MTVDTQEITQETEIEFTAEQQKLVDKRIGQARMKAREIATAEAKAAQEQEQDESEREQLAAAAEWEKLAKHHEGRVLELEGYEAEAKAYRELVTGMLKNRVKELGDVAKKAVSALPLTDLEKLNWLDKNQELFVNEGTPRVGTPARKKPSKVKIDKGQEHRPMRL